MGHSKSELESVDKKQKELYSQVLKKYLKGNEKTAVDFGCGPGRFTVFLSDFVSEKVYGVDPIQALIELAPKNEKVEYICSLQKDLKLQDKSADVIFISLVLGGIVNKEELKNTIEELKRISCDDALFFVAENTAKCKNSDYWHFREQKEYLKMFDFANLKLENTYEDLGEEISIFAGRKSVNNEN